MDLNHLATQIEEFKAGHLGLVVGRVSTNGTKVFLTGEGQQTPWPGSIPVTIMIEESADYQAEVIIRRLDTAWKVSNGLPVKHPGFF